MTEKPSVLFVCVHNAGRSQMAVAYPDPPSQGLSRSAWLRAGRPNPAAVAAMAEDNIDMSADPWCSPSMR